MTQGPSPSQLAPPLPPNPLPGSPHILLWGLSVCNGLCEREMGSRRGGGTGASGTHRKGVRGVGRTGAKGKPPNVPSGSGAPEAL